MKSPFLSSLALLALVACATISGGPGEEKQPSVGEGWALNGTWTDACCCTVPCPCLFGTSATEGFCEGASLFEVESGHYGDVPLDGVEAVVTYRVGGWTKVAVGDEATDAQVEAFGALLPKVLRFVSKGAEPEVGPARLDVSRDGTTVRYAAPGTAVELALVESSSGEPIVLQGLPAKGTPFPESHGHTQYKSLRLTHDSEDEGFEWKERNGFRSELALSSASAND